MDPLEALTPIEEDAVLRVEEEVMPTPYYVLNRNEGIDTLHRNPREECNVDDAEDRQTVDPETAEALITLGSAVRCTHCYQEEPPNAR